MSSLVRKRSFRQPNMDRSITPKVTITEIQSFCGSDDMSKRRRSRSGYVYAAAHPDHPHWIKWGFTRRAPLRRIAELSGTSVRSTFNIIDARFVWDAIAAEQYTHQQLSALGISRQKEFFEMDPSGVPALMDKMEQDDERRSRIASMNNTNDIEEDDAAIQSQYIEWLGGDLEAAIKKIQNHALKKLEKQSAQGQALASFVLAEHYMATAPALTADIWRHADCLFRAAHKQGDHEALFRSLFWKTFVDPTQLPHYWQEVSTWRARVIDEQFVPEIVLQTLRQEQECWACRPDRAQSWGQWSQSSAPSRSAAP